MQAKADVLAQLQRDILSLQGFKPIQEADLAVAGLQHINQSFPNGVFPLAALHEFTCAAAEEVVASCAFIAGIFASLKQRGGTAIWVSTSTLIFPPALKAFGIEPHQILFLHLKKEKDVMWAMEEALRCNAVSAVMGEMADLSFTASRRLQLAIEKGGASCFVVRRNPKNTTTTAVARWQIKPQTSRTEEGLPGVGYPRWQVNLLKVRNGRPGSWDIEWAQGGFRQVSKLAVIHTGLQKKTG